MGRYWDYSRVLYFSSFSPTPSLSSLVPAERGGGSGGIDDDGGEQYEDSKGNVLTRAQYEDLARQNLL